MEPEHKPNEEWSVKPNPEKSSSSGNGNTLRGSTSSESQSFANEPSVLQNVRNRKPTGPRTEEGKEKSKRNALKHGIFSQVVVLKQESRAEFDSLLTGLRNDLDPRGSLEEVLVDKLAALLWRHRRLIITEGEQSRRGVEALIDGLEHLGAPSLDLMLRYESTLERAFDRALSQLERLQRMRRGQPVPPRVEVEVK